VLSFTPGWNGRADLFVRRESFRLAIEFKQRQTHDLRFGPSVIGPLGSFIGSAKRSFGLNEDMLSDFLPRMKADRFMPVRRERSATIYSRFPTHALDKHSTLSSIRMLQSEEAVICSVINLPSISGEFTETRFTSANSAIRYAAIAGLGETGVAEDDALLTAFANIGFPKCASDNKGIGSLKR